MNEPTGQATPSDIPSNWREAITSLIAARVALIQLEAQEAARHGAKRAVGIAVGALSALFAWILLLAGAIGAVSAATGWAWHWLALGTGGLHALLAIILIFSLKKSSHAAFSLTRAEFQKDREWIENLQTNRKSND